MQNLNKFTGTCSISILTFFLLVFFTTSTASASPDELAAIRKAIRESGAGWTAEENYITELPKEERQRFHNAWIPVDEFSDVAVTPYAQDRMRGGLDWRNFEGENWVTIAKQQGSCGSCWSFAAIGALESLVHMAEEKPVTWNYEIDLSEQYVMSCGSNDDPCSGGFADTAMRILEDEGTVTESCMPYKTSNVSCSQRCSSYLSQLEKISGWDWVSNGTISESARENIMGALAHGPVPSTMYCCEDFDYYNGGIYSHSWGSCPTNAGHSILIVGYDEVQRYWIVKNSWNAQWGEGGFFRISWDDQGSQLGEFTTRLHYGSATCSDDGYEPNDFKAQSKPVDLGFIPALQLCPGDIDYYTLTLASSSAQVSIEVRFTDVLGDLNLRVLDPIGREIASSLSTSDDEKVVIVPQMEGEYRLVVFSDSDSVENRYDLLIENNCQPDCIGKSCGSDGCGEECGQCDGNDVCIVDHCICMPQCKSKICGPDGCGSQCGECSGAGVCENGRCICEPECDGKECGSDNCGLFCGICKDGLVCSDEGQCITESEAEEIEQNKQEQEEENNSSNKDDDEEDDEEDGLGTDGGSGCSSTESSTSAIFLIVFLVFAFYRTRKVKFCS